MHCNFYHVYTTLALILPSDAVVFFMSLTFHTFFFKGVSSAPVAKDAHVEEMVSRKIISLLYMGIKHGKQYYSNGGGSDPTVCARLMVPLRGSGRVRIVTRSPESWSIIVSGLSSITHE